MNRLGFLSYWCLALALSGCAILREAPATRFYVLTPLTDSDAASQPLDDAQRRLSVGLAPVAIPQYLDRPQMVSRAGANELILADFDQWAEPLPDSVTQVLAENLTRLLAPHGIEVLPETRASRSAYQLGVAMLRFERDADGACVLQARWTLTQEDEPTARVQNAFDVRMPVEAPGYEAIAAAMSRALGALSRDIALHLRAVATQGGAG